MVAYRAPSRIRACADLQHRDDAGLTDALPRQAEHQRIELRVALREWHKRIPEYSLEPGHQLMYRPNLREFNHLPIVFPKG